MYSDIRIRIKICNTDFAEICIELNVGRVKKHDSGYVNYNISTNSSNNFFVLFLSEDDYTEKLN